jgi:hypothetical protein
LSGALLAPLINPSPDVGAFPAIKSYVIVVLGGMGSVWGAMIAALAAALLTMRQVLDLHPIAPEKLPLRQARIAHWALTDPHDPATTAPALVDRHAALAIDEHEQVKVLSDRTWRGVWRTVTLWRDGVHGISAADLMQYLAHLTALAQQRAPDVVSVLLERSESIVAANALLPAGPRTRVD